MRGAIKKKYNIWPKVVKIKSDFYILIINNHKKIQYSSRKRFFHWKNLHNNSEIS